MTAIVDNQALWELAFGEISTPGLVWEKTALLCSLEQEMAGYFAGTLRRFKTPLHLVGTPFQNAAWEALLRIPYGQTRTYGAQAQYMGRPRACRAVGAANAKNRLAIVVPCHRVIPASGTTGGYASGPRRKEWLLTHEKKWFCRIC